MADPQHVIADVNYFGDTVVVKYEDGGIALLAGSAVRRAHDAAKSAASADANGTLELVPDPWKSE